MAVIGAWRARHVSGRPAVLGTPIEHKAVLGAMHEIAHEGGEERVAHVTPQGVVDEASFDALARRRLDDLLAIIAPSLDTPQLWAGTEDYVIYFLHHVSGVDDVAALLEHADVPALLLGETSSALSARTRRAINEHCFQYLKQDLAVIDWNSALVVEPSAAREVPDVIEFALTHLVEFRYYDDLLDEKLAKLYAAIGGSARRLRPTSYEPLSREAGTLFMEMTEFVERVENSFKVIGDYYLATIFRASVNRMRLHEWEGNVTRKVRLLGRVSELLSAQAATHRSHSLEWIVIGLIAFEIIWALAGH